MFDILYNIYVNYINRIHVAELELQRESSSRPDLIFIRKHGPEIFTALYESLELQNNTSENYDSIYATIALITVELLSEETMMDLIRLLLSMQVGQHAGSSINLLCFNF